MIEVSVFASLPIWLRFKKNIGRLNTEVRVRIVSGPGIICGQIGLVSGPRIICGGRAQLELFAIGLFAWMILAISNNKVGCLWPVSSRQAIL